MNNIPYIVSIRDKCRRVIIYFKQSSIAQNKLHKETQNLIGTPNHKLIIEVDIGWNSTYEMFTRLLQQKRAVVLALASLKYHFELLSDLEWNVLTIIVPILRIFFLVTEEFSSEKYVNLSKLIPLKKQLSILVCIINDNISVDNVLR